MYSLGPPGDLTVVVVVVVVMLTLTPRGAGFMNEKDWTRYATDCYSPETGTRNEQEN